MFKNFHNSIFSDASFGCWKGTCRYVYDSKCICPTTNDPQSILEFIFVSPPLGNLGINRAVAKNLLIL